MKAVLTKSLLREFSEEVKQVEDVIDLTIGDPHEANSWVIERLHEVILEKDFHYESALGNSQLRKEISINEKVGPQQVIICNGATQGLQLVLMTFFQPNDEIIIPFPCYPQYVSLCQFHQIKIKPLYLNRDYQIEEKELRKSIHENTKAILLNSPHNPTGTCLNEASIEILKQWLKDKEIMIIWDGVYAFDSEYKNEIRQLKPLIEIHSFSKSYAMCGLRLGYVIASIEMIHKMEMVHQMSEVCSSALVQRAMIGYSLNRPVKQYEQYRKNKQYVKERLLAMGLDCFGDEGAYYVFPSIHKTHLSSESFSRILLNQYHVGVLPGKYFYQENHIRISCCIEYEKLVEGMNRIQSFLECL